MISKLCFTLIILLVSTVTNANGKLHFFDRHGKKVEFVYTGDYKSPDSLMFLRDCVVVDCDDAQATKEMMYDFVDAVKKNKIYEYTEPYDECDAAINCEGIQRESSSDINQSARTLQKTINNKELVVTASDGTPIYTCKPHGMSCIIIEEIPAQASN